jgi:hypothetical protein
MSIGSEWFVDDISPEVWSRASWIPINKRNFICLIQSTVCCRHVPPRSTTCEFLSALDPGQSPHSLNHFEITLFVTYVIRKAFDNQYLRPSCMYYSSATTRRHLPMPTPTLTKATNCRKPTTSGPNDDRRCLSPR